MSALAGLRVIEIANERIAFAGKLLGDMGADVILIEPAGGATARGYPPYLEPHDSSAEPTSLHWLHYNTSKRSVVLNLDEEQSLADFVQLIASADVLIESEPTKRLQTLGIDYDQLSVANPKLIHLSMTPYGRDDPRSDLPATDLTILAAGGPVWSCGYDDHRLPPVRGWGNQGYQTGCHFAVMSVLTALMHRELGGAGQFIDVNMVAACNVTTEAASYSWLVAGATVQRQTGRHASVRASGTTQVRCADGKYVNTGVPPRVAGEFAKLLVWLRELKLEAQLPEAVFLEMGAAWEGPFDLSLIGQDDTITAIFSAGRDGLKLIASHLSAQEFFLGCQRAGLAVGVVNAPEEAFEDEHFKARGFQVELEHPELGRTLRYPGAPYRLPASPWKLARRAPLLGEHTEELLGK